MMPLNPIEMTNNHKNSTLIIIAVPNPPIFIHINTNSVTRDDISIKRTKTLKQYLTLTHGNSLRENCIERHLCWYNNLSSDDTRLVKDHNELMKDITMITSNCPVLAMNTAANNNCGIAVVYLHHMKMICSFINKTIEDKHTFKGGFNDSQIFVGG